MLSMECSLFVVSVDFKKKKRGQKIIPLKCLLLVTRQPALGWGKCLCACTSSRRLSVMTAERDRL